ncbi:MAG: propanoyl-CoA acyltransferase [Spirochaetes bacterium]|nr:propanoyl-CoA acyltransferase [Spirochaetota bacterium]MBU1081166.1 propanoyl-CoA acyltransferase [Spirochaetota bacterium]
MAGASIVGAYNTQFGSFVQKNRETGEIRDTRTIYQLMDEAIRGAVEDSGFAPEEIDAVWVGAFAPGLFTGQDHLGPYALEAFPEAFRFKPAQRVEGACASSSMAVLNAIYGIESGRYRTALVVGVEKMNLLKSTGVTHALAGASFWPSEGGTGMTFPGLFAEYAKGYRSRYGLGDEEFRRMLASAGALMYRNGVLNPLAHFGKGGPSDRSQLFTADAIMELPEEKNPMVADPLRLHDCSLVSDGAAALVIARTDIARARKEAVVEFAGIGHTTERLAIADRENMHELIAAKLAVAQAFGEAGVAAKDLKAVEVHDCFTVNQLLCTEALGLSKDGEAGRDYVAGRFSPGDACPVNLSGGLKAKGHPVGATGASMHVLLYKQMLGKPIGAARAAGVPEVTATLNVGGSAVTNSVTVLRRSR